MNVIYRRLLIAAAIVLALDQATKELALAGLDDGPVDIIEGAITLRLTFNSGGVFGVGQGLPGVFLAATLIIVVVILIGARRITDRTWAIPLGMVLGGGLGNVLDRLFRGDGGEVVDFVDLHVWPVFNLADASIVIAAGLILITGARSSEST